MPDEGPSNQVIGDTGNVLQARDIHGGVHYSSTNSHSVMNPRQLPMDSGLFSGRANELLAIDQIFERAQGDGASTLLISAIAGTAGVGKTALAVHWGHLNSHMFPDGQLYVNLRGFDAEAPVTVEAAIAGFLRALDVPPDQVPESLSDRTALFRSIVADKRLLVVLDNARTSEQVEPLLPGARSCFVLVTSRNMLSGLSATAGIARVALDLLPIDDALNLLQVAIGSERCKGERGVLLELCDLCARLPLALRVAAERISSRPQMRLRELVDDLADRKRRLDVLSLQDNQALAVRAVISWSYAALTAGAAQTFRALSLHPGAEIPRKLCYALSDSAPHEAQQSIEELVNFHLLEESSFGQYRFHDLLRLFAEEQWLSESDDGKSARAERRLFVWYLGSARKVAEQFWAPGRKPPLLSDETDDKGARFDEPADMDEALLWCSAQIDVLDKLLEQSNRQGIADVQWRLVAVLRVYFITQLSSGRLVTLHEQATRALNVCSDGPELGLPWAQELLADINRTCLKDAETAYSLYVEAERGFASQQDSASEIECMNKRACAIHQLSLTAGDGGQRRRQAIRLWRYALKRADEESLGACQLVCSLNLSRALWPFYIDEALDFYGRASKLRAQVGEPPDDMIIRPRLGSADRDHQIDYLIGAVESSRKSGDARSLAWNCHELAIVLEKEGHVHDALDVFRSVHVLFRKLDEEQCAQVESKIRDLEERAKHTSDVRRIAKLDALFVVKDVQQEVAGLALGKRARPDVATFYARFTSRDAATPSVAALGGAVSVLGVVLLIQGQGVLVRSVGVILLVVTVGIGVLLRLEIQREATRGEDSPGNGPPKN